MKLDDGQGISLNVIVIVAIVLLVLVILSIIFLGRMSVPVDKVSGCCDRAVNQVNRCGNGGGCVGLANPASVFCSCLGGSLAIKSNESGEYGVCHVGVVVKEEWELYSEKCEGGLL